MMDAAGRKLRLGDKVLVTGGGGVQQLILAELVKFTPKGCRVVLAANPRAWAQGDEIVRFSSQVCLIEHNPAREEELTNPTSPVEL